MEQEENKKPLLAFFKKNSEFEGLGNAQIFVCKKNEKKIWVQDLCNPRLQDFAEKDIDYVVVRFVNNTVLFCDKKRMYNLIYRYREEEINKISEPGSIENRVKELFLQEQKRNSSLVAFTETVEKNQEWLGQEPRRFKHSKSLEEIIELIEEEFGLGRLEDKLKKMIDADRRAIIVHGAPGTGKTHTVRKVARDYVSALIESNEKNKNFVQFHPSYDYTDFVEGLRPVTVEVEEGETTKTETTFVRLDGRFKAFCRWVEQQNKESKNKETPYIFIIDEINRADLAKVFGELMFNVEEGYRGRDNKIQTQYSNLPTYEVNEKTGIANVIAEDDFADGFYIPENVVIVGTMNDIDRSVDSIDFAMRRRFKFIKVNAKSEMESALESMFENEKKSLEDKYKIEFEKDVVSGIVAKLISSVSELNTVLRDGDEKVKGLGEDYMIGHAYFAGFFRCYYEKSGFCKNQETGKMQISNDDDAFKCAKSEIWEYSIQQLINEYLRGKKGMNEKIFENAFMSEK